MGEFTITTIVVSFATGLVTGAVWLYKTDVPNKTRDIVLLAAFWIVLLIRGGTGARVFWMGDSGISMGLFGIASVAIVLVGAIIRRVRRRRAEAGPVQP